MDKKLRKLARGHIVQFKKDELEKLPHEVFKPINAGKIIKSHKFGKGCRVQLDQDEQEMLGGKLGFKKAFKKIGRQANNIVHKVEKQLPNKQELKNFSRKLERGVDKGLSYAHKGLEFANDMGLSEVPILGSVSRVAEKAVGKADQMVDQAQAYRKQAKQSIENLQNQTAAGFTTRRGAGFTKRRGAGFTPIRGGQIGNDTIQTKRAIYAGRVYSDNNAVLARPDTQIFNPLKISTLGNVV